MSLKKNITITIACIITECLLSLIPAILILYAFFGDIIDENIFVVLAVVPLLIIVFNAVLFLISLFAKIFIKTTYIVEENYITKQSPHGTITVNFSEVHVITYDFGDLSKWNGHPSQLSLFDKSCNLLLCIKNPPIALVYLVKKRCKATTNYYHAKRIIYLLLLINGLVLLFCLLAKIFS